MWTQCTSVLVNKECWHMPQFQHSWQWLRDVLKLTSKYVDSYHIAVNITHGTMTALRIGTFRFVKKNWAPLLFFCLKITVEPYVCLWISKMRCIFQFPTIRSTSRTSSVGIVTSLWAGWPKNRGSILHKGLRFISFPKGPDHFWYPNNLCSMWTEFSSQGSKRLRREVGHLFLHSAGFKNAWCYTSIPPHAFMAWCLTVNRDNFTFINFML
jgi:hypothetical protein